MIKIENIIKSYDGQEVLNIPSFHFEKGKSYAIIGANGSGKSTLLKIIGGILTPNHGRVIFSDKSKKLAYSPQKSYAFSFSVEKNLRLACLDKKANREDINRLMHQLDIEKLKVKKANRLSGGEIQKVALARILLTQSAILVLDEPTASMDINSVMASEKLIKDYQKENNTTLVFATHSIKQARRMADYIVFLSGGKICEFGTPSKVLEKSQNPETIKFLNHLGA